MSNRPHLLWTCVLALLCGLAPVASAQDKSKAEELTERGDYLFKSGYYFRASDSYRLALVEDPTNPWRKLAFGHSLFAVGQYGYASYALRRGVAELDPKRTFDPEIAPLFPSRRRFQQALRDLKRYVTYSPRDAAGLTVLGYVLYSVPGEERRCRDMFRYLLRLNPDDAFASFFMDQLERRSKAAKEEPQAQRQGHPTSLIFKNFDEDQRERVTRALVAHPGISELKDDAGGPYHKVFFLYAAPNLDSNLRNLFASLGFKVTLRELATPDQKQLRSFMAELEEVAKKEEEPAPDAAPSEEEKKKSLKERVPTPERERERIENEWPKPKPAKAK